MNFTRARVSSCNGSSNDKSSCNDSSPHTKDDELLVEHAEFPANGFPTCSWYLSLKVSELLRPMTHTTLGTFYMFSLVTVLTCQLSEFRNANLEQRELVKRRQPLQPPRPRPCPDQSLLLASRLDVRSGAPCPSDGPRGPWRSGSRSHLFL